LRRFIPLLPVAAALVLTGCSCFTSAELQSIEEQRQTALRAATEPLEGENEDLKAQVADLQAELDGLRHTLPRLYQRFLMMQEEGNAEEAYQTARRLNEDFPGTFEATRSAKFAKSYEARRAKEAARALSGLKRRSDPGSGTTWYYDPATEGRFASAPLYLYITQKSGEAPMLRIRLQSADASGYPTRAFFLQTDRRDFTVRPPEASFRQQEVPGGLWRWIDRPAEESDRMMLRAIARSERAVISFLGSAYQDKLPLSREDRLAVSNILAAYDALRAVP